MSTADETGPQPTSLLRDTFPLPADGAWRQEVERLLQGADFEKAMVAVLAEGLRIQPLYTAEDLREGMWGDCLPGAAPFLRGTRAATGDAVVWLVAQEINAADAGAFNLALLHDLERGQSAVNLCLDRAGRRGLDAATAPADQVGTDGTALTGVVDLRRALASVDLGACPLLLQAGAATLPIAAMLVHLARERGLDPRALAGAWGCDPLALAAQGPPPALPSTVLFDHSALLTRWAGARAPALRTLAVTDEPWHEAGADGVLSLGLLLAGAVETLREMETRGLGPDECAPRLAFHLSLDTDFFLEIARLRALRVLWSDALEACGVAPTSETAAWIHARTGARMLTKLDAHTNLLRVTTAAMAAVCGGVDSLHVTAWDALAPAPGGAGRRLARNLQLILGHECRFGAVADPAGGSWYVERLTREVGEGAWSVLQQVEAAGGLGAALAKGLVQELVGESALRRAARLARVRDARVGVNRYCAPRPEPTVVPARDEGWLAERRAAAAAAGARAELEPIDPRGDAVAQMAALGAAVARGAALGALTAALGGDARTGSPFAGVVARRDAEPFEELVARAGQLAARDPRLTRAHCLCLGDAGRTGPRLDFARGTLAAAGLTVTSGAFHHEAPAAAAEAQASGAAIVVLVGLDETYPDLGAAVATLLGRGAQPPLLLAAGRPSASTENLERAGVARFLQLGSDLPAELGAVLRALGGGA